MLDGRLLDGRLPDGRLLDGRLLDGRLLDGRLLDGRLLDGRLLECLRERPNNRLLRGLWGLLWSLRSWRLRANLMRYRLHIGLLGRVEVDHGQVGVPSHTSGSLNASGPRDSRL